MDLILTSVLKSAGNLILFSVIPITWWFISSRKKVSFFRYAGLHKPSLSARWYHVLIIAAAILLLSRFDWTVLIPSSDIAVINQSESVSANAYAGLAWAAVIPAFIENFLANGFCEELFFRGFLTKRLISGIGVNGGIIVQAVIFGLIHNILCFAGGIRVSPAYHIVMFLMTFTGGSLLGILSEKILDGSILPGIILHGLVNFIMSMSIAFAK